MGDLDRVLTLVNQRFDDFEKSLHRELDSLDEDIKELQKIPRVCAANDMRIENQDKDLKHLKEKLATKASKKDLEKVKAKTKDGPTSQAIVTYGTAVAVVIYTLAKFMYPELIP